MTPADFRTMLPAFKNEPDANVQAALAASASYLSADDWGSFYNEALANWVADRIITDRALNGPASAGAGDATMKTVGSVSVQRDALNIAAQMRDPYLRTGYGQRYKHLIRLAFGGSTVAA